MLKINKILSKKIKSPLSLRGAKRRSNLSGFSLIELMVAAAILAFIVFGIFQAYSTGFMGMADARYRTVATNYAREAMEDVKNMDFEKITTTTKSVITSNVKYRIDVNVSSESANLKKVFTIVSWKDRNGVGKTVETSMSVNFTEIYASDAAKIVLFADSYTILSDGTARITAVIKDIKGNTVINWDGENISFSIQPEGDGDLIDETTTTNGIAEATFTYNGTVGIGEIDVYVIKASVTLPPPNAIVVSDSVTIKVTDGPVKIILDADPGVIKAGETSSSITVRLCDAENKTVLKSELGTEYVEITFEDFGEGNLSSLTITIPNIGDYPATAIIDLYSTGNPGLASVVATAAVLESDSVDVRFLGEPVSILVTASPNPIYVDDEGSTLTVSLLDVNGFPTNPSEGDIDILVEFTLSPDDNGDLDPTELIFTAYEYEGILLTTLFSGQTTTEAVTIDTLNTAGLTNSSVTINILSELVPDRIELTASPQNVAAGSSSTITATVYAGSKIATNYKGTITFETTLGVFSNGYDTILEDVGNGGKATTVLTSSSLLPGNAIITITDPDPDVLPFNPSTGLVVGFYSEPDHIKLTASSQNVVVGDSSTITATVCDLNSIHIPNYEGTITFYIVFEGLFSYDISVYTTTGTATTDISYGSPGTAAVTASSWYEAIELTSEDPEEIEVDFYVETDLILVEESVDYDLADLIVGFKVDVVGELDILVDEMKIMWTESAPQERLSEILIGGVEVYTGSVKSGTIVDIFDVENSLDVVNLSNEVPTEIKLTFMQDMAGRQIDVMFYPPATGWYLIRFDVP